MNPDKLQKRNISDLQQVLKTSAGRRVLWRILQACQVRQHGFVPGDAFATSFHCGQRSIGLFLWEEIEQAHAGAYQQMRSEYQAEVTAAQNQLQEENEHE
ncbi:MAG: hypothetical protein IKW71_00330 [Elusimicrobiaceae bacterium]|nr:hypothetical protein [Elusimicrobiaceae bacterium]